MFTYPWAKPGMTSLVRGEREADRTRPARRVRSVHGKRGENMASVTGNQATPPSAAPSGPLVLVIASEQMGRSPEEELGHLLMRNFFHALTEVEPKPHAIIFFNSGVKLVTEGTPILEDLQALSERGVRLLACGTCLNFYEMRDRLAVGEVTNMYTIAETMLRAGKVVAV